MMLYVKISMTLYKVCYCYMIAGYEVTRPAVARVINEDNYNTGVVKYVSNGSVVFGRGESYRTLWPGKLQL